VIVTLESVFDDVLVCKQFSCYNCKKFCDGLCFCDSCLHDHSFDSIDFGLDNDVIIDDNLSFCLDADKRLYIKGSDSNYKNCNVISDVNCGLDNYCKGIMGNFMHKDTDFHNVLNHSMSDNVLNQHCVEIYNAINQGVYNNTDISEACIDNNVCHHISNVIRDTCVNHSSDIAEVFFR
jgi:hypothetical protein